MNKVGRIIALVAIIAVILIAVVASISHQPSNSDQVWDAQTTLGNPDAKNYFVVYSDIACPYCIAFENAILEKEEDFQKYIESNDILYEVRLTDYLYEFGESQPNHSRYGALAAYCARNEGKFWDYYNNAIRTTWRDYYEKGGKEGGYGLFNKDKSYWIDLGREVGLGDAFASCVENEDTLDEVKANTEKASKQAYGMPYFKFNKYTMSGFDMAGDWNNVMFYFQRGLDSK